MINTLRADCYRLAHTKGFWLTQGILITVLVFSILTQSTGSVGVNQLDNPKLTAEATIWTGKLALKAMCSMVSFLLYTMWPLLVIIIGHDFTKQTYKNSLTVGVSRTKYFFSKYLTVILVTALQLFYFYVVSFTIASLLNGVGAGFGRAYLLETLNYFLIQLVLLSAIMAIAMFVLCLTGNTIATVLTGVITPIVIAISQFSLPKLTLLYYLNFQNLADNIMTLGLNSPELPAIITTAVITIIIMISASLIVFKKREL